MKNKGWVILFLGAVVFSAVRSAEANILITEILADPPPGIQGANCIT